MKTKQIIIGDPLPNIPWENKPAGNREVMWRHSGNPIINLHPFPKARSIYNSSVVPFGDSFIGMLEIF